MKQYSDRIEINPKIMLGKPVFKGTRIPVYVVLNLLAEGYTTEKIIKEFPDLKKNDIVSALHFAASISKFEDIHA
jgi:uncharacterized protein (DUF433 family)